jgi:hypothetical protein
LSVLETRSIHPSSDASITSRSNCTSKGETSNSSGNGANNEIDDPVASGYDATCRIDRCGAHGFCADSGDLVEGFEDDGGGGGGVCSIVECGVPDRKLI